MTININPFIVSGTIPKPYFCDRVKETEVLNMAIQNQMNVVITSPRRMGKTALVDFVFHQRKHRGPLLHHQCRYSPHHLFQRNSSTHLAQPSMTR